MVYSLEGKSEQKTKHQASKQAKVRKVNNQINFE